MSKLNDFVAKLETNVQKLFHKIEEQKQEKTVLQKEIEVLNESLIQLKQQNITLQDEIQSLRLTNSLVGSEQYKRETKLKINSLVKEIDYCISQLSS